MTDTPPTIASPDDISAEFAARAYHGTSFTPGPWHVSDIETTWGGGLVYGFDKRLVADCKTFRPETAANARLIAAAPELLEALIECESYLVGAGMEHDTSVKKASAAIVKATWGAA